MAKGYGFITTQSRAGFKPIIGHQGPPRVGGFQIRLPDNGARHAVAAQGTLCKVCACPLEFAGRRWGVESGLWQPSPVAAPATNPLSPSAAPLAMTI